jgi:hypothetical protein
VCPFGLITLSLTEKCVEKKQCVPSFSTNSPRNIFPCDNFVNACRNPRRSRRTGSVVADRFWWKLEVVAKLNKNCVDGGRRYLRNGVAYISATGVTFQTTSTLISPLTLSIAAFKWRKDQSVTNREIMYAYIQGIRLQGHLPISLFALLKPEKLYFNGF